MGDGIIEGGPAAPGRSPWLQNQRVLVTTRSHRSPVNEGSHIGHRLIARYQLLSSHAIRTTGVVAVYDDVMCVTWRKLQTPGIAEEHKRQETPTM